MILDWVHPGLWFEEVVSLSRKRRASGDPPLDLLVWLESEVDSVRAYHFCRPISVDGYLENGIVPRRPEELRATARQMFVGADGVSEDELEAAIGEVGFDSKLGKAFLVLDWRPGMKYWGHYLVYGSEFLCAVAGMLDVTPGRTFRRTLASTGIPTVFDCIVPMEMIPAATLRELWAAVFRQACAPSPFVMEEIDFTITIDRPLAPERIEAWWHPETIVDPLDGMREIRTGYDGSVYRRPDA